MKNLFYFLLFPMGFLFTSCIKVECPKCNEIECTEEDESNDPIEDELTSNDFLLHYKLDNNFIDSSPNKFDGTAEGVKFGKDRFGNANSSAYFDGVDDYINLPNISRLKPQLPVSFSFWVNYETSDFKDHPIFNTSHEENRSSGIVFNTSQNSNNFSINYGNGSESYSEQTRRTYSSNYSVVPGRWDHIVVIVKSAQEMQIYVNGVEAGGNYSGLTKHNLIQNTYSI